MLHDHQLWVRGQPYTWSSGLVRGLSSAVSWWPRHGQLGVHNNTGTQHVLQETFISEAPDGHTARMDTQAKRLPGASGDRGGGGRAVPSSSLPAASDAALPGPLPAAGEGGCQEGVPPHPPLRWAPPSLPGKRPATAALVGVRCLGWHDWPSPAHGQAGGDITGPAQDVHVGTDKRLWIQSWGRKGTVTERAREAGGKRKMETEAEGGEREEARGGRQSNKQQKPRFSLLDIRPVTCGDRPERRRAPNSSPELHPAPALHPAPELHPAGASRAPSPSVFRHPLMSPRCV